LSEASPVPLFASPSVHIMTLGPIAPFEAIFVAASKARPSAVELLLEHFSTDYLSQKNDF
jgi:hypothetical protein